MLVLDQILTLLIYLVVGLAILISVIGYFKIRSGLIHGGPKEVKFEDSSMAQHVKNHYEARERKHKKRIKRSERIMHGSSETSLIHAWARRVLIGNQDKLKRTQAMKNTEMNLMKKMFSHPSLGPRVKGDKIHYGIRREGFGHERHKHEWRDKKK